MPKNDTVIEKLREARFGDKGDEPVVESVEDMERRLQDSAVLNSTEVDVVMETLADRGQSDVQKMLREYTQFNPNAHLLDFNRFLYKLVLDNVIQQPRGAEEVEVDGQTVLKVNATSPIKLTDLYQRSLQK